jgi:hypothetical protein
MALEHREDADTEEWAPRLMRDDEENVRTTRARMPVDKDSFEVIAKKIRYGCCSRHC